MSDKAGRTRKLIHVFTGLLVLLLTYWVDKSVLLWLIIGGALFAFLTFPFNQFSFLHRTTDNSYGTLFYPAGILTAYLLLMNKHIDFFRISLLLLTISDTLANLSGKIIRHNVHFKITGERKSIFGILAFLISSWFILLLYLPESLLNFSVIVILLIAFINFELISFYGSDNLTIALGSALIFSFAPLHNDAELYYFILLLIIMSVGAYLLYYLRFLSRFGSLVAYLIGVYLFGFLDFRWGTPVLFFFFTSVIFTKIHSEVKSRGKTSAPRNSWQVTANILPALIISAIYLFTQNEILILLYISLIAAVTADTWASEIGPVFNRRCFSLADFKPAKAGISGGISLAGSLAALTASFAATIFSYYLIYSEWNSGIILALTLSGFFASFIDSVLGAFWEPHLLNSEFFLPRNISAGERPTPNDLVNVTGSATAPFFFLMMI